MNATLAEEVRSKYAWLARDAIQKEFSQLTVLGACCGGSSSGACCSTHAEHQHDTGLPATPFGSSLYPASDLEEVPNVAVSASCGCGNPAALAQPAAGEVVLDLGSGSGIDCLLAAARVGPQGRVYGVDITNEMVALANSVKRSAGHFNVEFLAAPMEQLPLPDRSVDVVISNCAVSLATDKQAVFEEIARVLRPGGRVAICDVVASDDLSAAERGERGSYAECIAGALSMAEFRSGLEEAGVSEVRLGVTHPVANRMFAAAITGRKPAA